MKKENQQKAISVIKNRCKICQIGIGRSKIISTNEDGSEKVEYFKHTETTPYKYKYKGKYITVCGECLEELNEMKAPALYIKRNKYE